MATQVVACGFPTRVGAETLSFLENMTVLMMSNNSFFL